MFLQFWWNHCRRPSVLVHHLAIGSRKKPLTFLVQWGRFLAVIFLGSGVICLFSRQFKRCNQLPLRIPDCGLFAIAYATEYWYGITQNVTGTCTCTLTMINSHVDYRYIPVMRVCNVTIYIYSIVHICFMYIQVWNRDEQHLYSMETAKWKLPMHKIHSQMVPRRLDGNRIHAALVSHGLSLGSSTGLCGGDLTYLPTTQHK